LSVSEKQAQILDVKAYTRWSPYLEKCCLLVSANESYERTAEDIEVLTGVRVSHSTQQRLVHRQTFDLPQVEQMVNLRGRCGKDNDLSNKGYCFKT